MCRLEPFLKRSLVVLLFLGLAEACVPREVAMEEKIKSWTNVPLVPAHPVFPDPLVHTVLKGILGLMGRLSPDGFRQNIISSSKTPPLVTTPDKSEEEMKRILGLLSLQVLNEETSNCKEEVKPPPATTTVRGLVRTSGWNFLRCAYMVITFFFVSYNKGDWCYCRYCNPDLDLRDDPCCSFQ
ncbi:epididymal protein 13 isoform X2 [Mus musculus]|uniref:epididymal protein 13 isoform X2 n=1 Tax=Mus musculus TaxID=10090 RepID=UPI0005ABA112|nr:epididymal protein 13 isoform X2 [Mus musculus]|eukprot:XP_011248968.1 PREDICTED: epididymis-specific protein isoform X2 [Mus musculus]